MEVTPPTAWIITAWLLKCHKYFLTVYCYWSTICNRESFAIGLGNRWDYIDPTPSPPSWVGGGGEPCARHIRLYSKCPITFSARFDLLAVIYLPRLDALYAILPTAFRRHLFLTIYHYTLWAICSSNRFHHVFRLLFEKSVLYNKKARSILLHRTKVQRNIL